MAILDALIPDLEQKLWAKLTDFIAKNAIDTEPDGTMCFPFDIKETLERLTTEFVKEYRANITSPVEARFTASAIDVEDFVESFSFDTRVFECRRKGGRHSLEVIRIIYFLVSLLVFLALVIYGIGLLDSRQKTKHLQEREGKQSASSEKSLSGPMDEKNMLDKHQEPTSTSQDSLCTKYNVDENANRPASFRRCLCEVGVAFILAVSWVSCALVMNTLLVYFGFELVDLRYLYLASSF